jgi:Flp pilus assembly protein TadD
MTDHDRPASLRSAATLIDRGDLSGAESVLEPLLLRSPEDALALNLMGVVRLRQGHSDAAEKLLRHAVEIKPQLAGPHLNLAFLYGPERASSAIAQLREALKLTPTDQAAQAALRFIAQKAALASVRSGDKQHAVSVMLEARAILPQDPELLYQFGLVAMEAGLYTDARKAEEEALRFRPGYAEAIYALGRACLGEGNGQQAEDQFRKYLAIQPKDATAQYGLGYVLVSEQKLAEARLAFERSLALQPNQTESLFQLGVIALREANPDSARAWFGKVLAQNPQHAGALTEIAIFSYRDHLYQQAADGLERAIRSSPAYQKAHYHLALALAKLGRKEESEREFSVAMELKKAPVSGLLTASPQ